MKKISALLLAAVMCFGLATPVYGDFVGKANRR